MNLENRMRKLESAATLAPEMREPLDLAFYDLSLVDSNHLVKACLMLGREFPDIPEIERLLESGNIAPERVTRDLASHRGYATQAADRVHFSCMRRFYTWAALTSACVTLPPDN